jgi:microcystin-dependent protein
MATTITDRFGNSSPTGSIITTPLIGTSTSSQTVSTSSGLTFSVQANRAWKPGTRLRAASTDATKIMEGETVTYAGSTELVMEVDYTEGSGSTDSWTLGVCGVRGSSGAQGATGATGATGSSGADGADGVSGAPQVYSRSTDFTYSSTDISSLYAINPTSGSVVGTLTGGSSAGAMAKFSNQTAGKGVVITPQSTSVTINGSTASQRIPGRSALGLVAESTINWIVTEAPRAFVSQQVAHGSTALPDDSWVWPDGSSLDRVSYAGLFAVFSTRFGAGSTTTFAVPDLRERVVAGWGAMGGSTSPERLTNAISGVSGSTIGAAGGNEGITLTAAQSGVPAHTHGSGGSGFLVVGVSANADGNAGTTYGSAANTAANSASSAASAHPNVQPTFILPFAMKA